MPVAVERYGSKQEQEFISIQTEKRPFAFDLGRERELIQLYGDAYKDFFVAQAHYYAKESYGKVPKVEYSHDIERKMDGSVKLQFGPNGDYAEKSYGEPVFDEELPEWYRRRAGADVRWTLSLQKKLTNAKPDDTFIDLSPTEFGVSIEERKKWGFGWHSFVRVHKVIIDENGKEKLISRGIRNYLDLPEQRKLFEDLTGEKIKEGEDMLCKVGNLKPGVEPGHIDKKIKELWNATPLSRRLWPEEDQLQKSEEEMDTKLVNLDKWLEGIFYLMKHNAQEWRIEKEFHGWENAVKAAVEEEKFDFKMLGEIDARAFIDHRLDERVGVIQEFIDREYKPGTNGCGFGSGFRGRGNVEVRSGKMDYLSITQDEDNYSFDQPGPCRTCGRDVLCGPCKMCESCDKRARAGESLEEVNVEAA